MDPIYFIHCTDTRHGADGWLVGEPALQFNRTSDNDNTCVNMDLKDSLLIIVALMLQDILVATLEI